MEPMPIPFKRSRPAELERFEPRDLTTSIVRAAVAFGRARIDRSLSAEEHAQTAWPHDLEAILLTRAAVSPTDMTSAAPLIHIALALFPLLTPFSTALQLMDKGLKVGLAPGAGAFTVPGLLATGAQWVGEGAPKPVAQGATSGVRIDPHKLAGIAVASEELYAQASVDTVLRAMLGESAGPIIDGVFFSQTAATAAHPAGILNGVAALTPTAATGQKNDAILGDLQALIAAIGPVAGAASIGLIMNPGQAVALQYGVFQNIEQNVYGSNYIPMKTVIAVVESAIVSAVGVPSYETSTQATLHMDSAPGAVVASSPTRSLWQTGTVAVKMVYPCTWGLRSASAVAWMQNVNW